jgi:hypothetical protein
MREGRAAVYAAVRLFPPDATVPEAAYSLFFRNML